jgi:hypothetical protein
MEQLREGLANAESEAHDGRHPERGEVSRASDRRANS